MKTFAPNAEQSASLVAWRAEAVELMPYMATILFAFRPLSAPGLGTFACDRYLRLYIDFEAAEQMGSRLCAEALLHECAHIYQHDAERAEECGVAPEDRRLFNTAADAANNDDLVLAGCAALGEFGVLPSRLGAEDHQTAEFYYDLLKRTEPPKSDDTGDADESDIGKGDQSGSGGQGTAYDGCGSGGGGDSAPCELDPTDDAGGAAPAASKTERQLIDVATSAAVRDAHARQRGTVPRDILRRAEEVLQPSRVPWRRVLSAAIRRSVASKSGDADVTYSRRNRRASHIPFGDGSLIRPGMESPTPSLVVVRDTSGSMSDYQLAEALAEIEGVARSVGARDENLLVVDIDAAVSAVRQYRNVASVADARGGGGTDMRVGIESAVSLKPKPNAIIVVTDGETPWPDAPVGVRVVACLVGASERSVNNVPEWITTVVVE